jgi:hypothetical protein
MTDDELRSEVAPNGDPIDTFTMWLDYPEGEAALSLDLTAFNAAMRRARGPLGSTEDPPATEGRSE